MAMIGLGILLWVLSGIVVVVYGIRVKEKYGFGSQFNLANLMIVVLGIIIWPHTLLMIIQNVKNQEEAIARAIAEDPRLTHESIFKGVRILREMKKGRWPW